MDDALVMRRQLQGGRAVLCFEDRIPLPLQRFEREATEVGLVLHKKDRAHGLGLECCPARLGGRSRFTFFLRTRQINLERRAALSLAEDVNVTATLLDNAIDGGE